MHNKIDVKKIKSALISVFYKDGIGDIVKKLSDLGVKIYSTGGTFDFIKKMNVSVEAVEDLTGYPSIFGGRVKTLHPKVFGGILCRRDNDNDIADREKYDIPEIDLVIVDLYPFEETVASKASESDIIEKIDIGGISLIRAAAKNFNDVLVVASRTEYSDLLNLLNEKNGETSISDRKLFAAKAFNVSSNYDTKIFEYFNTDAKLNVFKQSETQAKELRYGENPHQKASFFGNLDEVFEQIHGKEISYNNLLDIDAAVSLINEFTEPTFAILKHNNACGCAVRSNLIDAWNVALAADPLSAYGGVLIANRNIDKTCAEAINKIFFEVILAPSYDEDALQILESKKNRIILVLKKTALPDLQYRTALNGVLQQERDKAVGGRTSEIIYATEAKPTKAQIDDLIFANILVKHSKSNSIVLAKDNALIASGVGQTSRVDALKQAIEKAQNYKHSLQGAVMASDAFFPFADCVQIAHEAGVTAVIQPGGSIRDKDSVDYCNANGVAMIMTGTRHFKH